MFRTFHRRILILVVGLVLTAQLATFGAVLTTIDADVKAETRLDIEKGSTLIGQLINKRLVLLLNGAEVLAADYGFKSAIASMDRETIKSALDNGLLRIDADVAGLVSLDGKLIVSTHATSDDSATEMMDTDLYAELASTANREGTASATSVLAGSARQIVMVPVKAPIALGWLVLGFSLDDELAAELETQAGMDITFVEYLNTNQVHNQLPTRGDDTATTLRHADNATLDSHAPMMAAAIEPPRRSHFGSTLSSEQRSELSDALQNLTYSDAGDVMMLRNEHFLAYELPLDHQAKVAGNGVAIILQKSLDKAFANYRELRNHLILLVTLSLAFALALAYRLAHGVTRPVLQLSAAANRISGGDYGTRLELNREDEFGQLANTFDRMQDDIASREATILHQAFHDELTGLPNQRLARDRLDQQLKQAMRDKQSIAVVLISLNRYQQITGTLGHAIGERLVQKVATRLGKRVRAADTLARVSTDSFLLIMSQSEEQDVHVLIKDLVPRLIRPIKLDAAELVPDFTIGAVLLPEHADNAADAMRRSSIALADARESQTLLAFYVHGRDESHRRKLSIVADLQRAVDEDELTMHYQPKITMGSGQVASAEALVRWIHPEHGFMPPDEFIGLAESSGNISMVTDWVLRTVIRQLSLWQQQYIKVSCAVNLSALDLQDDSLPERIDGWLAEFNLSPTRLILEVTESAMMRDTDQALRLLGELRERGISISIDDFGTGYSSLAKLRELPVDELKIDRAFIIDIEPDTTEALIVKAIIDLGHGIGLKVTSEGVETQAEWDVLSKMGNDTVQGYLISKPMPAADFSKWWQTHNEGPIADVG